MIHEVVVLSGCVRYSHDIILIPLLAAGSSFQQTTQMISVTSDGIGVFGSFQVGYFHLLSMLRKISGCASYFQIHTY